MSLQVWLPLTKDLRQQGLSDTVITNHGATFDSNGKLGGCYSFDGTDDNLSYTPSVDEAETLSIAFWVCPAAATPAGSFFSLERGTYWQLTFYGDHVAIRDNSIGYSGTRKNFSTGTYIANTWTHVAVTYDKGTLKIYRDGSLLSTNSVGGTKLNTSIDNARIGSAVQSGYYYSGKMNDVRIYDNCLSSMEVKELAKGLVLHYPLNRGGRGQENLLVDTYNWSTLTNASSVSEGYWYNNGGTAVRGYDNINNITYCKIWHSDNSSWTRYSRQYVTMQPNTYYTVSILCRINTDIAHLSIRNDRNEAITFFALNVELTNKNWEWKTFTAKTHTNTSQEPFVIYAQVNSDGVLSSDTSIDIAMVKLEEGSIATPWCPNSSDTLATTLGLNSTIEYDCSGFCNNGIRYGTFEFNSDTPKYSVSTQYNGTDNTIQIPFNASLWQTNFTMNIWFKKDDLGSKSYETLFGGPSGFEMDTRSGASTTLSLYMASTRGGTVYTGFQFGEWYMVTLVNDGTNELYYINGELVKTIEKKGMPTGNYWIGSWAGADKQNYKGLISDARVYATALSADDVKSLYQNCATIDPDGIIRGQIRS